MKFFFLFALFTFLLGCNYYGAEKDFVFILEDKEIKVEVSSEKGGKRIAYFQNKIENSDKNLRQISMELIVNTFSKPPGSFDLKEMKKTSTTEELVTTCWQVSNSQQNFCVLPVGVSENYIVTLAFWLK